MKKGLLIALMLVGIQHFAQAARGDSLPKWTIGIIAVGHYQGPFQSFQPQFLPGIQVNRKIGKYELRLGVEHTVSNRINGPQMDYMWGNGSHNNTLLRIGIERGVTISKRFSAYGAVDLAARYQRGQYESFGCWGPNGTVNYLSQGLGVLPTAGIQFKASKRISIFAEYRAEFFVSDVTEKTMFSDGNIDTRPYHYTSFDFNFGTIGQVGMKISL